MNEPQESEVGETVVRLNGLYDDSRREELALAMIPVLAGLSTTINFKDVEHIDVAALVSLLPALQAKLDEGKQTIRAIGMNQDVANSLKRAGLEGYFRES